MGSLNFIADASVLAKWFLTDEPNSEQALALWEAQLQRTAVVAAPSLALYELGNVLMRRTDESRTNEALDLTWQTEVAWLPMDQESTKLAVEMAADHDLSFCDASYLACALRYRTPLVSDDRALVNAAMDEGFGIALDRLQLPADG